MRFSAGEAVDDAKLEAITCEIGKPRLVRALTSWRKVVAEQGAVGVERWELRPSHWSSASTIQPAG